MTDLAIYHDSAFEGDSTETRPIGGTESSEIYIARELAKLGLDVVVFSKCSAPGTYNKVNFMNCDDFASFNRKNRAKIFIAQTNPDMFLNDINADVKTYLTDGAYTVRGNRNLSGKEIQARIDKYIFKSKWQVETFIKHFNIASGKVFLTRNGIYLSNYAHPEIKKEKNRLIYVSEATRGLDVLLDIFPKVRKDFPDLTLYVYSDYEFYGQPKGSAYIEYKHIFDKTKQPGVHNMGNVKPQELAKEFLKTYLLAYPCHFEENCPTVTIEALAAGVPVLTTALAGLKETVLDNVTGKLIPGNALSWWYKHRFIKELKAVLSNETEWQRLSRNSLERAKKYYTWEMIAKEWLAEFKPYL